MDIRERILKSDDFEIRKLETKYWGTIWVKTMSAKDRDRWENRNTDNKGNIKANMGNIRASFLVVCICDENGALVFAEKDIEALGAKSSRSVSEVFDLALELNKVEAADVEKMAKN
jgi:hypothetical protein